MLLLVSVYPKNLLANRMGTKTSIYLLLFICLLVPLVAGARNGTQKVKTNRRHREGRQQVSACGEYVNDYLGSRVLALFVECLYLSVSHIVTSSIFSRLVVTNPFERYSFCDCDMKILFDIVRNILSETTSIIQSQSSSQKYSSESKNMLQVVSCRVFQRKLCDPRRSNRLETKVGDVMD